MDRAQSLDCGNQACHALFVLVRICVMGEVLEETNIHTAPLQCRVTAQNIVPVDGMKLQLVQRLVIPRETRKVVPSHGVYICLANLFR